MGLTSPDIERKVRHAVDLCRQGDWDKGIVLLGREVDSKHPKGEVPALAYAYLGYGLARYRNRHLDGLKLCKHSVRLSEFSPECYCLLARVNLLMERRYAALKALRRGLILDPTQRDLIELRREIGVRRRPPIPFLSRDNPINYWLGIAFFKARAKK